MKKIAVLMMTLMIGLSSAFACESIFDKIDGITCEIQYCLCKDNKVDIKVCDKVLEKVEQYEEALEKNRKINRPIEEINKKIRALEEDPDADKKEIAHLIRERNILEIEIKLDEKYVSVGTIIENFLGEESLKLIVSEEFYDEVWSVLDDYLDYNYLMD